MEPKDVQLRPEERRALKKLISQGWDMVFDHRHWQCLCKLARKTNTSVPHTLRAILEKVFTQELGMIKADDDMMDRPLRTIRSKIDRFRLQPEKLERLLRERYGELVLLADAFPEEVDPKMADIVTRIRARYIAPSPERIMQPDERPVTNITDRRIDELTAALRLKGKR